MKKNVIFIVVLLVIVIVAAVLLFSDSKEQNSLNNQTQNQKETSSQENNKEAEGQDVVATAELVGKTEKNGIPIPQFANMDEFVRGEGEGGSFTLVYSTNKIEMQTIKDFYQENLGEDWQLKSQHQSDQEAVLSYAKGDNFKLEVVLMTNVTGGSQDDLGIAINYEAPFKEDPYPSAINVEPTSENAEKYHNDFSEVFNQIFGGSKLVKTSAYDSISLDYIIKEPATIEDTTELRNSLTDKGYDIKKVSKEKDKAAYDLEKTYGDWSDIDLRIYIGEYINKAQKIEVTIWP